MSDLIGTMAGHGWATDAKKKKFCNKEGCRDIYYQVLLEFGDFSVTNHFDCSSLALIAPADVIPGHYWPIIFK